jgi:hypothetical protein
MTISMEEVHILIHQNALDEMTLREMRLERLIQASIAELDELRGDIRRKQLCIKSARDAMLRRTV